MSFQLVQKSVTLNDLERRNGRYFALFHRIRQLWGQLRHSGLKIAHIVGDRNVVQRTSFQ